MNNELIHILETNFNFDLKLAQSELDSESAFLNQLKLKLAERIKFFIRTDIDKLMQALYRIDVDDKLSDQAFNLGEINQIADKLAELIIMRQLQKIDYARKFNKN